MSTETHASLEVFRKEARRLKKAHALHDADALALVAKHITSDKPLKHADYLHVIAREAGHDSWPKLKFSLESADMNREEQAERLKRALFFGQHWATEKLLEANPDLGKANLGLQLALGDLKAVKSALASDPQNATRPIGIRTPILHLCFSKEVHRRPELSDDMTAIAELLVANGASVNDGYPPEPGADHKLSALYGAMCHADNFELGRWLLGNGADPNDNESLYHSTELGHTKALECLLQNGARPDGTNALPRALDFGNQEMIHLLLEHGADPNVTVPDHPSGQAMNTIPSLHQAIRRKTSMPIIELLLQHGADAKAVWEGHTAYAMARIFRNQPAAHHLEEKGFRTSLSAAEETLAGCADGRVLGANVELSDLGPEDRMLLTRLASEPGNLNQIKALVASGLDPDETDEMGLPPVHVAGWNGLGEEVAYFLSLDPDLSRKNDFGGDALDTVLHGSEFAPQHPQADHTECARQLLEAGSLIYPDFLTGCGNEEMVAFLESWIETHPESLTQRL
ncbi:MAG: ankyrin repeat domain-containing protein [Roseibium sp.]